MKLNFLKFEALTLSQFARKYFWRAEVFMSYFGENDISFIVELKTEIKQDIHDALTFYLLSNSAATFLSHCVEKTHQNQAKKETIRIKSWVLSFCRCGTLECTSMAKGKDELTELFFSSISGLRAGGLGAHIQTRNSSKCFQVSDLLSFKILCQGITRSFWWIWNNMQ